MEIPCLRVDEFKERLKPLLDSEPQGGVVFDADGTLWSHDVGCMVFDFALSKKAFREESLSALLSELELRSGKPSQAKNANDAAEQLREIWLAGNYEDRAFAELQVWAYAGFNEEEFRAISREALASGKHDSTLHTEIFALSDWVRARGAEAYIVSASPLWVVEEATQKYGFAPGVIAAGEPLLTKETEGARILPRMGRVLPYGPDKVHAGRALLGERVWLATLGDSSFDLEMMGAARLAGGLGDKPSLLQGLASLPHAVRLLLSPADAEC